MAKELKLISWNVNGIRAVVRKGFLKYLADQQPDILCLQETKAQPDQLGEDILKPEGYTTYWNYPREKKGYSGVAILTREKPEDVRDAIGTFVDSRMDLVYYMFHGWTYWEVKGFEKINDLALDKDTYETIKKEALDPYLFVRDAYMQYRQNKVRH